MRNTNPTLTIKKVIICDDVRQETNGKSILIGVHAGDILVPNFPAVFPLALWINARIENGNGTTSFDFRFRNIENQSVSGVAGKLYLPPGTTDNTTFAFQQMPIQIDKESTLIAELKLGDEDWIELERVGVKERQDP